MYVLYGNSTVVIAETDNNYKLISAKSAIAGLPVIEDISNEQALKYISDIVLKDYTNEEYKKL